MPSPIPTTRSDSPTSSPLPGITPANGFRFRRGQELFLRKLAAALQRGEDNHLGVFVPGYGKTITALSSFIVAHALGVARKLVVFVPRGNLRDQYADRAELDRVFRNLGAPAFSFCVADSERVFLKNLDTSIIITTYQYASGRGGHRALLEYCRSAPCMFVFDEVHHLSDDGLWASKISQFPFECSVALSGTPMRSDNRTLFGVPFEVREDGDQYYVSLHEVTMRDAHAEGRILKRVKAHVIDYRLKLKHHDTGETVEMSLSKLAEIARDKNDIDAFLARKRLRFHEVYLESLLNPAFECFAQKRRSVERQRGSDRNHQMLIIAMSNRHAEAILAFVRERYAQYRSARVGQDVPEAERRAVLKSYRDGGVDVMVQVDMIGEGTDIKPISVIVKADLVRAYSKTMQQIFRGMRYFDGFSERSNVCDIFAANDSEVVATLNLITSEEQLGVRMRREAEQRDEPVVRSESEQTPWQLHEVQHHDMRTHSLELFPDYAAEHDDGQPSASEPSAARPTLDDARPRVLDVSMQEQQLRQECAQLAAQLAFLLRGRGHHVEERFVHAEWKRRRAKSQDELSLRELRGKKVWLERCLSAKRLL